MKLFSLLPRRLSHFACNSPPFVPPFSHCPPPPNGVAWTR